MSIGVLKYSENTWIITNDREKECEYFVHRKHNSVTFF